MPNDTETPTVYQLDDAMKELVDIFQKCKESSHMGEKRNQNDQKGLHDMIKYPESSTTINDPSDKATETVELETKIPRNISSQNAARLTGTDGDDTIEKLRQKQSELQNQLDEALKVAKELKLKQKKKLSGLIHEGKANQFGVINDPDEDIELLEFHQIEIELRISDLNRQLGNIQEELRLRLYKRLQSKTTGALTSSSSDRHQNSSQGNQRDASVRRNSAQTDESTPPSSSCSNETTTTSTADTMPSCSTSIGIDSELSRQFEKCNSFKPNDLNHSSHFGQLENDQADGAITNQSIDIETKTMHESGLETERADLQSASEHNYEIISPTLSGVKRDVTGAPSKTPSRIPTISNLHRRTHNNDSNIRSNDIQTSSNGYRNCPATNDLERIEEGEEEDAGYYCNSEKFRSIYEQQISPMLHATDSDNTKRSINHSEHYNHLKSPNTKKQTFKNAVNDSVYATPRPPQDSRFNITNINSAKRGNRPLTIYLPRPDEEIDLVETVQSLGHDLDILSTDLKVSSTSAQGYLYKSCSNNVKKWLKRYFLFNRETKTLSYYESEEQLVKRNESPRCTISFEEISDVYVDHRLSEKQKSTPRKGYVFVLATIKRKYLLASPKAETMRAWIDILFTAAKANDYFQEIGNDDENPSFNYDSFKEE